jgi:hypothetical protein
MIILSSNAGFEGICRVSNAASRTRKRNSQVRAADQQNTEGVRITNPANASKACRRGTTQKSRVVRFKARRLPWPRLANKEGDAFLLAPRTRMWCRLAQSNPLCSTEPPNLRSLERCLELAPSSLGRFIRPPLPCRIRARRIGALDARTLDHRPMPRSYSRQQLS